MWSKFKNVIFGKKEHTSQELMALAIDEMEQALLRHQKATHKAQQREEELAKHLANASNAMNEWKDSVAQAVKKKQNTFAKRLLGKEGLLQHRLQHFQSLHQQALQALTVLEKQQQMLVLKIEEVKSKQVMLTAQLDGMQSQQDIQRFLQDLEGNDLWGGLGTTLDEFDEADPMDMAIDAAIGDEVDEARLLAIQQELEAATLAKHKEAEAKKLQRAQGFFQNSPTPPTNKVAEHKKKEQLQAFMNSQATPVNDTNKQALLEAFKNNDASNQPLNQQQEDLLKQFMAQQEQAIHTNEEEWIAEALKKLESTKEKPVLDPKAQNKIDDFFKNS